MSRRKSRSSKPIASKASPEDAPSRLTSADILRPIPHLLFQHEIISPDRTLDRLFGLNNQTGKFVRVDIATEGLTESVIFIDEYGLDHKEIYNSGLDAIKKDARFSGKNFDVLLMDAGDLWAIDKGDGSFSVSIINSSSTLAGELGESREQRNTYANTDRQQTQRTFEQVFESRQEDTRSVHVALDLP